MRIAVLTFPLYTNYGGILQAYALQTVLQKMGHKVEFICRKRKMPTPMSTSVKIKRFILKYCLFRKLAPLREDVFYARWKIENKNTWKFVDKYIQRRELVSFLDIKATDYDVIIVGSDQVWRPKYFTAHYESIANAYLNFTEGWNIKRIAYAVSFGTEEWEYTKEDTAVCKKLVSNFDAVSCREQSGVILCKEHFQIKAKWVLDPTLLLGMDRYLSLLKVNQNQNKNKKGLLCYILNSTQDTDFLISQISRYLGLDSFSVNSKVEDDNKLNVIYTQPPVEDWIQGFLDASFVVTDSFHACVFSIIFEKPFIVYGNKSRGLSRIESLLSMVRASNRLVCDIKTFDTGILNERLHIDVETLHFMKNESMKYLSSLLSVSNVN